ncbi:MAG: shikimate dehydrogenase [Bacilli bacterium]
MADHIDLLAVLGHPVGHSLSPAMHGAAIAALKLAAVYAAVDLPPEQLEQGLQAVRVLGYRGANLTIPHKERALQWLDDCSESAVRIGAVNTIIRSGDRLFGDNTDGRGWARSIREELGITLSGVRACIVGAGGAARAVADALLASGAEQVVLCNRDVDRAERLALTLRRQYPASDVRSFAPAGLRTEGIDLLVNTTPIGMYGHSEGALPIAAGLLHESMVVSDLVYRPRRTALLSAAQCAGAAIHEGIGMLVWQGALAFEEWFGAPAPVAVMREAALRRLEP